MDIKGSELWDKDVEGKAANVLIDFFINAGAKNHYVQDRMYKGDKYTITVQKAGKDTVTDYIGQLKDRIADLEAKLNDGK
jgi:beta-galactosidase GanA